MSGQDAGGRDAQNACVLVLSAGCRLTHGAMHEVARQVDATGGAAVGEPERADLPESRMSCFFILL